MRFHLLLFLCLIGLNWACSNTKYLSKGELLYTGAQVKIEKQGDFELQKNLEDEVYAVIEPKPNKTFLGLRAKLWAYNIAGEPKGKGLRYWLRNKVGEPPVIFDSRQVERSKDLILNRLENLGHFLAKVSSEEEEKKQRIEVVYTVYLNEPYLIDSIFFPEGNTPVEQAIRAQQKNSLLQTGQTYNLSRFENERVRIDSALKQQGYYFFSPEAIIYEADTTVGATKQNTETASRESALLLDSLRKTHRVNLYLGVKEDIPQENLQTYRIDDIQIYPNYRLNPRKERKNDTLVLPENDFVIVTNRPDRYRPKMFERSLFLEKGQLYNREDQQITLKRFAGLGLFKFVNLDLRRDSTQQQVLDANLFLTPQLRRNIKVELKAQTQSNGFAGPELQIEASNRNLFHAGEFLSLQLGGGYQQQFTSQPTIDHIWWLEFAAELNFPYFLVPFVNLEKHYNQYTPYTKLRGAYRLTRFQPILETNAFELDFGYEWRETTTKKHKLYPASILLQQSNFRDGNTETDVDNTLSGLSLDDQLILSTYYEFTLDDQLEERKRHNFYYRGYLETAGNLASLASNLSGNHQGERPYELLGVAYSQFFRIENEFRHYFNFSSKQTLATRLLTQVGIPFANSETLPFFKQYFVGGANSVRAFPVRSLGPGTFRDTLANQGFVRQAGDIRLEFNTEYRFDIFSYLKGALFLDVGNVWLLREDEDRLGGEFEFDDFLEEMAIGTGFGLRVDISLLVLRFDFGIPVRQPFPSPRWVIQDFSWPWFKDNFVFNLAIGYPF